MRASSILPPGLATVHLDSFQPCPWTYFLRFAGLFGAEYSELSIARSSGTLKKVLESYKKKDLLILDEWLIRPLSPQESYDMLEIVEARCHKSTIFCTQYESEGWYTRIDPNPESDSPVSEAIMDRIIHNAYEVLVDGRVSMRERKGLKAAREGGGQDA